MNNEMKKLHLIEMRLINRCRRQDIDPYICGHLQEVSQSAEEMAVADYLCKVRIAREECLKCL